MKVADAGRLSSEKYRLRVAIWYLRASNSLFLGLKSQQGKNDFHFVVTLRSFIEYTRRGVWFLAWATDEQVEAVKKLTFDKSGSPGLAAMDQMINEALGRGKLCPLKNPISGINEPFINCLHALTHGNPISVRVLGFGLEKIFHTDKLLQKAEADLNLFRVLIYRRLLGEELKDIWKMLGTIYHDPAVLREGARTAVIQLKDSGILEALEALQRQKSI
jgi:hypothetical protein